MSKFLERVGYKFSSFVNLKEGKESLDAHIIRADPPPKLPLGIERLSEAFKKSKEVPIGKEVDSKSGGEKDVTLKSRKFFIVGGAVRDYLLGHTPKNYNLVTDAHPDEVEKIMLHARPAIQVIKKDNKNGIVKVKIDDETYEIETMKLPTSEYTTDPSQDSTRRDVTINSLYYEPSTQKIYDYTGGLRHIKDKTVKFIGNPSERIKEDGIRKYRYARMLNKVAGSRIDPETKEAISKHENEDIAPEKIRDEFWRGMEDLHSNAAKYLKTYAELGLLQTVFPKLELTLDFPNCKTCKTRPIVLACLLKNNSPNVLVKQLRELKYTDNEIRSAVFLINLLLFKPEYTFDFKKEMITTGLTKRQIMDWAKINNLDTDMIEKLVDYKIGTSNSVL